jgi:hypothetical protein
LGTITKKLFQVFEIQSRGGNFEIHSLFIIFNLQIFVYCPMSNVWSDVISGFVSDVMSNDMSDHPTWIIFIV